jgi:phage-related tail fiber protein
MGTYDGFVSQLLGGNYAINPQHEWQNAIYNQQAQNAQNMQQMRYDYYASLQNAQAQMMNYAQWTSTASVSIPERTTVLVRLWRFAKRWYRRLDWWQWDVEYDQ